MKNKPTIGQTLYLVNSGNNARSVPQVITPAQVISVGRKYFKVKHSWMEIEFHLEDWRENTEYTPGWYIYETEKEFTDEKTRSKNMRTLRELFSWESTCKLKNETIQAIVDMCEKELKPQ